MIRPNPGRTLISTKLHLARAAWYPDVLRPRDPSFLETNTHGLWSVVDQGETSIRLSPTVLAEPVGHRDLDTTGNMV